MQNVWFYTTVQNVTFKSYFTIFCHTVCYADFTVDLQHFLALFSIFFEDNINLHFYKIQGTLFCRSFWNKCC